MVDIRSVLLQQNQPLRHANILSKMRTLRCERFFLNRFKQLVDFYSYSRRFKLTTCLRSQVVLFWLTAEFKIAMSYHGGDLMHTKDVLKLKQYLHHLKAWSIVILPHLCVFMSGFELLSAGTRVSISGRTYAFVMGKKGKCFDKTCWLYPNRKLYWCSTLFIQNHNSNFIF